MKFFTNFNIPKSQIELDYKSSIFLLGSCFAENIGNLLHNYRFNCLINPFGILFHPLALERKINEIINSKLINEAEILYFNEQYLSLHSHSSLNKFEKDEFVKFYNSKISESNQFLGKASHIIITLGTSWVYKYLKTNEIVANCHKFPQIEFEKRILTINEITKSLENIIDLLTKYNPSIKIIFTISPVRHIKDGFMENSLSKSHLISSVYSLINNRDENFSIFPAYEIMLDELRDYRFYKEDYLHPNELAIQYIWEKFMDTYCSFETKENFKKVEQINKDLNHKPFNPNSKSHQIFVNQLNKKISNFVNENPNIKF